jgi:hypothetical protein
VTGDVDWRVKRAGLYWIEREMGRSCAAARSGSLGRVGDDRQYEM